MPQIEMVDTGVIYRTPNPGYDYYFACHSHAVQLSGQELLCVFQRGRALYSTDSVMVQARSVDGGKTWRDEGVIHSPAGDDCPYSYHGPFLSLLPDGSLIMTASRWGRSDPDHPLFNEQTGGIVPPEILIYRSSNGGANWSGPQVLEKLPGWILTPSCPIVPLAGGSLFFVFDQWHAYEEPGPYRPRTVGLFSSDNGQSWGDPVIFAEYDGSGIGHWHGRVIRLRDDRLFTLFWTAEMGTGGAQPLHYCIGSPDGRRWSKPEPTNIPGQTNWVADLGDGRMAVIYTVRETDPPGFFAACSEDGGRHWDLDHQVQVWDATGRDKIGVDASDSYPRSHDTISYGAPTSLMLEDGNIFTTFWCTEVSVTQIRYARLRVS